MRLATTFLSEVSYFHADLSRPFWTFVFHDLSAFTTTIAPAGGRSVKCIKLNMLREVISRH